LVLCLGAAMRLEPFKTGSIAPDQVLRERPRDVTELGSPDGELPPGIFAAFPTENAFGNIDAAIADINARAGNQLSHLGMTFAAEGAHGEIGCAGHLEEIDFILRAVAPCSSIAFCLLLEHSPCLAF